MQAYHTKSAHIASITVGICLALGYTFKRIPQDKTTILISMILLMIAGIFFSGKSGQWKWIATYFIIWLIGCAIEWIWIATCRPYGCFSYSDILWPKFFNTFPLLLVGIWPFLVLSMAHLIPKQFTWKHFITVGILLLLLLDLALDPVHIHQWIWSYEPTTPNRFGVPFQNFIWRIITGGLSMWVAEKRKSTITHPAWYYSGITILILFWIQFLMLIF